MNEGKEDPILAAPNPVKDDLPTSTPMDTQDENVPSDHVDEVEKIRPNYDERRVSLLNNPTYGVILGFLEKFRTHIDIQDYPLHLLEENLLSDEQNISRRLIDFHLTLLKRISLGKGAQREKFVPIITKFAYRFDYDDGEYLKTNGYSQAEIDIKLRILKNLLETQFDHNQGFKTALLEKQSFEVRSQPFGRDRSGASYWLFLDSECFIRLFRETVDDDRTWINVAKDKDEFESIIKLLITDSVVRKKFSEWKFNYEPFNSLEANNDFQERYIPAPVIIKKEEPEPELKPAIKISRRSASVADVEPPIKIEKKVPSTPKKSAAPPPIKNEAQSDHESSNSADKTSQRSRVISSEDTNSNAPTQEINNNQEDQKHKSASKKSRRRKSKGWNKKKKRTVSSTSKKEEPPPAPVPVAPEIKTPTRGRKRKQVEAEEEQIDNKKNEQKQTSQTKDITPIPNDDDLLNDEGLPIALRRSKRARKAPISEPPPVTSSPTKSAPQTPNKKKLTNGKCKHSSQTPVKSSQSSKTKKGRKGRRRGKGSMNGASSSDEHQPSEEEEEEDEYNSDDYLPDKKQLDELDEEDLREEEDEDYTPRRSAKTVAKRHVQLNEDIQSASSACYVCSKTDRPEALLLCDDCDDAYHLECLKPILLAVPDGDWYCPMCEHKRLCDNFIEKYIQLLKDYEELQAKRNQCMSKRTNRLANVMLNLDRMVKRSSKKRRTNGIVYSDEENEDDDMDEEEEEKEEEEPEDQDDDSVYGFKDDGSIDGEDKAKRSSISPRGRRDRQRGGEPERLGVRSCRRKPQNYRFDDYDKKLKEAMMDAGEDGDAIDKDLESDDDDGDEKKSPKKRSGYNKDEDFDISDAKNDDEFAPDQNHSDDSDSEEEEEDYDDDDESSDGDWKSKRRSSSRKKQPTRSSRRRTRNRSDDDSLSESELNNFQSFNTTKSETTNDLDLSDDRRRSSRNATQKNYAKDDDDDEEEGSDEDLYENGRPPPRRMRYKKHHGSDDSFVDDDDDYEKLQRKRKIVKYGKTVARSSITDHLKKLVHEEEPTEDKPSESPSHDGPKEDTNNIPKEQNKPSAMEFNEPQPSDDDDFPDEQEIFQANGLLKLQKTINPPKPMSIRPAFMAPPHSYQHAIVDPTARFAMIRPPVRPNGYPSNGHDPNLIGEIQPPSDSNQVNGHNNFSS